ncbi:MAG: CorA family divalent cation transporter, partial [Spirochaetota bacterium]
PVNFVAWQANGQVLIQGPFANYNGTPRLGLARLNADGSLDAGFAPGDRAANVSALAWQADGKVVFSGNFTSLDGTPVACLARLNADGSLDTNFCAAASADTNALSIAVQPDGKIALAEGPGSIQAFIDPDAAERRLLLDEFGIDPHDLSSALDPDELGRFEVDGNRLNIIMKLPRNFTSANQLLFTVTSAGLFLLPDRLIIVTTDDADLFEDRAIKVVRTLRGAMLKVFYGAIGHFLGHLKVINMLSESLEKRVNLSMGNRYLLDMFTLEKSLVYFVNGIASNEAVLEKFRSNAQKTGAAVEEIDLLDDIVIENQQCGKQAEIYSNILTGLMDARGSVVNNNLSILMKRLTIVSIIFMPMNVIAGMGGMSEFSAMTQGIPYWISYPLFAIFLAGTGFFTLFMLRQTGLDSADNMVAEDRRKKSPRWYGGFKKNRRSTRDVDF